MFLSYVYYLTTSLKARFDGLRAFSGALASDKERQRRLRRRECQVRRWRRAWRKPSEKPHPSTGAGFRHQNCILMRPNQPKNDQRVDFNIF